jgi:integrase
MELGEPHRTLVFHVAVTGLRISEALGLKWSDPDYQRQMIHLRRVWVGNELVSSASEDGRGDWVFPSTKMKGRMQSGFIMHGQQLGAC